MKSKFELDKIYSIFLDHYGICKRDPDTIIVSRAGSVPLKAPLFISWEITSSCNLLCRHCRAAFNHSRTVSAYHSVDDYFRVIHNFGNNEIHRIGITGGEPFLHPYLFDILSACKIVGIDIIIYTNATLIGDDEANRLNSILTKDDIVHVSLDGGTPEANDNQRGTDAFCRTIKGLEKLRAYNVPIRLNVVPTRLNEDSLLELCDIAIQFGAKEFGASPLMTSGRATIEDLAPDYRKLFQIEIDIVNRLNGTDVTYIGGISGAIHDYLNVPELFESGVFSLNREIRYRKICDAGNRKLFVDAGGDVYPCSLCASNPIFTMGNIFKIP